MSSPETRPVVGVASPRLAALRYRDFRLFWAGQAVSLVGTQIQRVAVAWQLYLLTHSPVSLGLLGLFRMLPVVLLALGGGIVADAFDRRRLVMATQAVLALCSTALAIATHTGHVSPALIYATFFVAGCAAAFDNPARQSLVTNLIPAEHLQNALSLNVLTWQIASVVGPGVGGLLLDAGGLTLAYAIDAVSFLAVIGSLAAMSHRVPPVNVERPSVRSAIDGLLFVFHQPVILGMMMLDFVGTFLADSSMLLPIFAAEVLHVGASGLGWMVAARPVGAVMAALALAGITVKARGKWVLAAVVVYGLATAAFGASRHLGLSLACLAVAGTADTISMLLRQTMRYQLTPDEMRGRMTAVTMIFFVGGPQLGEIESGLAAGLLGAPLAVTVGGIACALFAVAVAVGSPALRRHRA